MAFTNKPQVFNAKINPITFGANGHEVTLGGSNVYPLYSFDAPIENAPKVGIEISDKGFNAELPELAKFYEGCTTVVEMAKRAAGAEGVDFVCLRLESADPNAENTSSEECAALAKAVAEANMECSHDSLIFQHAVADRNLNTRFDDGQTPLHLSAILGHNAIAKYLLENNASTSVQDSSGATPLHEAIRYGNLEIAKMLLDAGANVNAKDHQGFTPLQRAAMYGYINVAKTLIEPDEFSISLILVAFNFSETDL